MKYTLDGVIRTVCDLYIVNSYPKAEERILLSLGTPQIGPYHNEGLFMDSHLRLMLKTSHHAAGGVVEHVRRNSDEERILINTIKSPSADITDFEISTDILTFIVLHDLFKPFTMNVRTEKVRSRRFMTWDEWLKVRDSGLPFQFKGSVIKKISYYLPMPRKKDGLSKHGEIAKAYYIDRGIPVPSKVLKAIGGHDEIYFDQYFETAIGFEAFVKKHDMDHDDLDFFLAVTYVDRMSALDTEGKPSMGPFLRVLARYKEYIAKTAHFATAE